MIDKQTIITLYRVNKLSRRAIARQLHLNRRTITKVIAECRSTEKTGADTGGY